MSRTIAVPRPHGAKQWGIAILGLFATLCLCCGVGSAAISRISPDRADTGVAAAGRAAPVTLVTQVVEVTRIIEITATPQAGPAVAPTETPTPVPPTTEPATPTAEVAAVTPVVDGQPAQVVNVIDGDTIDVMIDGQPETIRYIGVDSPETNSQLGQDAAAANNALVAGETVYLLPDVTDRDQYGRLLRYVYLVDGRMVNQELVGLGHALSVAYPPDTAHQADFDAAQQQAQAERSGMWQSLGWATKAANIRTGPGTNYPVVDGAQPGQVLDVEGRNVAGDWLKLGTGGWIAAQFVDNVSLDLPIIEAPAPPTPQPATPTPVPQRAEPVAPPPAPVAPAAVCQCSGVDYDCDNFSSWSDAQACYQYCLQTAGYDVHRLDRDNDGIVCESMR